MKGVARILIIYTVQTGDTLTEIADRYNVSRAELIEANQLNYPDRLVVGQALVIPGNSADTHTVLRGETLFLIAEKYGVTVDELMEANPEIANPSAIYIGQNIRIPGGLPELSDSIDVNGYAYYTMNRDTLARTLPDLTYLSIFSHDARPTGRLADIADSSIIDAAWSGGAGPIMVVTNIKEGGNFDSGLASWLLTDEATRNRLIQNIVDTAVEKNYYGVDIDFENVYGGDREAYNSFLRDLSEQLHANGLILTTAIAPKTSANMKGILYEGHDYAAHGRYADRITLMTYEWVQLSTNSKPPNNCWAVSLINTYLTSYYCMTCTAFGNSPLLSSLLCSKEEYDPLPFHRIQNAVRIPGKFHSGGYMQPACLSPQKRAGSAIFLRMDRYPDRAEIHKFLLASVPQMYLHADALPLQP